MHLSKFGTPNLSHPLYFWYQTALAAKFDNPFYLVATGGSPQISARFVIPTLITSSLQWKWQFQSQYALLSVLSR